MIFIYREWLLVFLVISKLLLEFSNFSLGLLERLFETFTFSQDFTHHLFTLPFFLLHLLNLTLRWDTLTPALIQVLYRSLWFQCQNWTKFRRAYLQQIDESQIVQRDVIIVVLDITERLLVIFHESIDLTILALFNLMDFSFSPQLQFLPENLHFVLVFGLKFLSMSLRISSQGCDSFIMFLWKTGSAFSNL